MNSIRVTSSLLLLLCTAIGCSSDGGGKSNSATIGSAGGTVDLASGAAVTVPAGALAADVEVGVGELPRNGIAALPSGSFAGTPVAFTPHGTTFTAPVAVQVPVEASASMLLRLEDEADTTFEVMSGAVIADGLATVSVSSFSVFVGATGFNPLIGTWSRCEADGATSSEESYTFTDTTLTITDENFASSDCSGAATDTSSEVNPYVNSGEHTLDDASTAIKIDVTVDSTNVFYTFVQVIGNYIVFGDADADPSKDGSTDFARPTTAGANPEEFHNGGILIPGSGGDEILVHAAMGTQLSVEGSWFLCYDQLASDVDEGERHIFTGTNVDILNYTYSTTDGSCSAGETFDSGASFSGLTAGPTSDRVLTGGWSDTNDVLTAPMLADGSGPLPTPVTATVIPVTGAVSGSMVRFLDDTGTPIRMYRGVNRPQVSCDDNGEDICMTIHDYLEKE